MMKTLGLYAFLSILGSILAAYDHIDGWAGVTAAIGYALIAVVITAGVAAWYYWPPFE